MALQLDEVREVISVNGRSLEIIDLARKRAERAEATAQAQTVTATNWQARAIRAEEGKRQAEQTARFWHGQEGQRTVQLRQAERLSWLCVALAFLVLALGVALFIVAVRGA